MPPAVRALASSRMLMLHAAGAVALTVAVMLGLWQYDAWQVGRDLAARDLAGARPVPLDDVLGPDDPYPGDQVGRPVRLSGQWLPDSTVTVAGRTLDGRDGSWVVTPVAVCAAGECGEAPAVLVVRGWVADGSTPPGPPSGAVEVTGWLQPGDGEGLPDPDPTDDVLPELRIPSAVQHVDTDLYGGYVIERVPAGSAAADGLEPVTPDALPQPDSSTSLRNLLYAAEWFVFGGFALFLWWRWVRDELARVAPHDRARDTDEDVPTAEIASSS